MRTLWSHIVNNNFKQNLNTKLHICSLNKLYANLYEHAQRVGKKKNTKEENFRI